MGYTLLPMPGRLNLGRFAALLAARGLITMNAIDKAKQDAAIAIAKAEREDAITTALSAIGAPAPRMISVNELYGSLASIHYGDRYGRENHLTLAECTRLAESLPGVPTVQVRDGCLSHKPKSYVEALPEEKKERWESETDVCPVLLKIDQTAGYSPVYTLEWYAELPGVGIVRVDCDLSSLGQVASYSARRVNNMGGFRYESPVSFVKAVDVEDSTGEIVAQLQPRITWASGSEESPKPVTYFWIDVHTDGKTTTADILRALAVAK